MNSKSFHFVPSSEEEQRRINEAISLYLKHETVSYTKDIEKAFYLFECLRRSRFCCLKIEIDSDYSYTYGIKLTEDSRSKNCINQEKADKHEPSLWLDVAHEELSLLISVAFVWANKIEVPGVVMPWERG